MNIETLHDVLEWTRQLHRYLSNCCHHCANASESERARLLLDYLADHEKQLANVIKEFEDQIDEKMAGTWLYEYVQRQKLTTHKQCSKPFAEMAPAEIIEEVVSMHDQVVELYRQLSNQIELRSIRDSLEELAELEKHEAMRIVQSGNRLEDL